MVLFQYPLNLLFVFFLGTVLCSRQRASGSWQQFGNPWQRASSIASIASQWAPPSVLGYDIPSAAAAKDFARSKTHELATGVKSTLGGHPVTDRCVDYLADTFEKNYLGPAEAEDDEDNAVGKLQHKEFGELASLLFKTAAPGQATKVDMVSGIADIVNKEEGGQEKIAQALTSMAAMGLATGIVSFATGGVVNPLTQAGAGILAKYLSENIAPPVKDHIFAEYKKFTEAGKNPVDAMSSAMEVISLEAQHMENTPYIQTEPKVLLGCEFNDINEYTYNRKSAFGGRRSKWADREIRSMVFKNTDQFNRFKAVLGDICSSVMESTTYNDVDQLIRFFTEFKDQNKYNLGAFFKRYKYKLRPYQDTVVFELKVINQLKTHYKEAAKHFYLVTAYMNIPGTLLEEVNYNPTVKKVPADFFHGHVAGAFKIQIGRRRGYIIMDLSLGVNIPIVLMEDWKAPHFDTVIRGDSKIVFHLPTKGSSFVIAHIFQNTPQGWELKSSHLYYVRLPYCAFLEVTYKPNLLIPIHGMIRRQRNGAKSALLNFRILPKKLLGGKYFFNVVSFDKNGGNLGTGKSILFEHIGNMTEAQKKVMSEVAKDLGMSLSHLQGKLAAVKVLIFDNDELVQQIYELNKALELLDESAIQQKTAQEREEDIQAAENGNPDAGLSSAFWNRDVLGGLSSAATKFGGFGQFGQAVGKLGQLGKLANFGGNDAETRKMEFLKATQNQNECVKKPHVTNLK